MDYVDGSDAARLLDNRYPTGMPLEQVVSIVDFTGVIETKPVRNA